MVPLPWAGVLEFWKINFSDLITLVRLDLSAWFFFMIEIKLSYLATTAGFDNWLL